MPPNIPIARFGCQWTATSTNSLSNTTTLFPQSPNFPHIATEKTNEAIDQLLDYCATYPNNDMVYRSRDMILCAHSDAGFHNESRGRSRSGAHIFLAEDEPIPKWNGPVLTIAQIIKFVMALASEAELGAMFITVQAMVSQRNTLEEMVWKQPHSPHS